MSTYRSTSSPNEHIMSTINPTRSAPAQDDAFRGLLDAWLAFDDVRSDAGTTHAQRYAAFDHLVGARAQVRAARQGRQRG